jgi:hypothetical protein
VARRTIRRPRPSSHRDNNDAVTRGYGRELRQILKDWARTGAPIGALATRFDDAAKRRFESGYLSGKHQAYPKSGMTRLDWLHVNDRLMRNSAFVRRGLVLDVQRKLDLLQPKTADERARVVDQSFGARVENLYGGVLWSVHELGHVNGWRQLGRYTRIFTRRALVQQDEEEIDPEELDQLDLPPGDVLDDENGLLTAAELALALGITLGELDAIMSSAIPVRFGVHYDDAGDEEVCGPCLENAEENDGDYWEPEEAPIPGDDCRGGGNCRCTTSEMWEFGY